MKIFISWSGDVSLAIARVLRDWLHTVLPHARAWLSAHDVEYGERWNREMSRELDESSVGIICIVGENLRAPWIHFEAGALSKSKNADTSRVVPLLFGVDVSELPATLSQFQAAIYGREVLHRMVKQFSSTQTVREADELDAKFNLAWSGFDSEIAHIMRSASPAGPSPPGAREDQPVNLSDEAVAMLRDVAREKVLDVAAHKGVLRVRAEHCAAELVQRGYARWRTSYRGRTDKLHLTDEGRSFLIDNKLL
jgi:hypothetical protein